MPIGIGIILAWLALGGQQSTPPHKPPTLQEMMPKCSGGAPPPACDLDTENAKELTLSSSGDWSTAISINLSPNPTVAISGGQHLIIITDEHGDLMVDVMADGTVTFGEKQKPTDAAKAFWKALADEYISVCAERIKKPN